MRILSRQVVDMKDRLVRSILASLDISGLWHPEDSVFVSSTSEQQALKPSSPQPQKTILPTRISSLKSRLPSWAATKIQLNAKLEVKTVELMRHGGGRS